jgi:hypothetical protein
MNVQSIILIMIVFVRPKEVIYILDKSKKLDPELQKQFADLIDYYHIWSNKIKSDSDFAKDLRNFMEHLKGYLNNGSDLKSFSWDKMIDKISISDPKIKVIFKKQLKVYELLYESLSQILKENITKVRLPIQDHYDNLIRMTYSIMTCIDPHKFKK